MLITEIINQFFFIYSNLAFLSSRLFRNKDRLAKVITDLFLLIYSLLATEFAEFDCSVAEITSLIIFQSLFSQRKDSTFQNYLSVFSRIKISILFIFIFEIDFIFHF